MVKQAKENEIQYHLGLSKEMLNGAEYVIMPGDPKRSKSIANSLDPNAKFLADSREHVSYLANFYGNNILVCSSGLGAPNIGISIEELAVLGLKYYLRVGTCGTIQPHIELGDVIITTAAVRLDGASKDYAPIEYPAVSSLEFTNDLINGAKQTMIPFHTGITASTDTFWQAQERYDSYTGYLLRNKRGSMDEWRALNVLNFEMEASALFVMASTMRLHATCLCSVIAKRTESEKVSVDTKMGIAKSNWEKATAAGIHSSLVRRGLAIS
jgi:uridine phosphorylase